jgi:uncharacterized RDD family membrane protein YckC
MPGEPASREAEELVVATPERVAFRFETAGLGSRFAAQLIDVLVLWGLLLALGGACLGLGAVTGRGDAALLAFILVGFAIFWGYWIVPEALWSGQTLGKRLLHLRVVDAGGGPITVGQAIVRNLVRVVDFLPLYYAVGAIAIFASPRNQRLGDLAAGTVVVRERLAVRLDDLAAATAAAGAGAAGMPRPVPAARLEPRLRRFVVAYGQRRSYLPPAHRDQLARQVEPALRGALPDVVAARGPLAALDQLADGELGS